MSRRSRISRRSQPNPHSGQGDRRYRFSKKTGEQSRKFLDRLYWTLGTFCLVWSITAVIAIVRRTTLDLPVFGSAQLSETIIFTQIAFVILLPAQLFVVLVFRAFAARKGWATRFPGAPADFWQIPAAFSSLRVVIFLALVLCPVGAMGFCYARMIEDLRMDSNRVPSASQQPKILNIKILPDHLTGSRATFSAPPIAEFAGNTPQIGRVALAQNLTITIQEAVPISTPTPTPTPTLPVSLEGLKMFQFLPPGFEHSDPDWRWADKSFYLAPGARAARISAFPGWEPTILGLLFLAYASISLWCFCTPEGYGLRTYQATRKRITLLGGSR